MSNNPLRQYFRRPALCISLPSKGKYYPAGAIDMPETGELPVYPMTAIDEITSKTPDALFNGSAVVEIVKSCVPSIKDPWKIPSSDLDTILIGIRAATNGNDLDIESECPACKEISSYSINIVNLLANLDSSSYELPMSLGELTLKFKPLTYNEVNKGNLAQFDLQREAMEIQSLENEEERTNKTNAITKQLTMLNIELIAGSIESISTPQDVVTNPVFITEYLQGCDKNTFETVRQHVIKLREASSIKPFKIKCVNCEHEYSQPLALNVSDFFG